MRADRDEILNQLSRAARLLDQKRWDDLHQVFAPEVTFDYGDGLGLRAGIDELRNQFKRFLNNCGATQHLLGSTIVTLDGTRATTEAYVQARHHGLGALAGDIFDTSGEYTDHWASTPDGWRITHRQVAWMTLHGNADILAN